MSKRIYKFFGGALKSQEKWLNKMAEKGWRLAKTNKASYEFEECKPSAYRYTVDFVGEKSEKDAAEYKAFLEDCGYRVFFKNINLDYSVGKVEWRPWANKGGKFAMTGGALYKELLIVEKENDGKPFELHTTEEDILKYKKTLRKPWIFLLTAVLVTAIVNLAANIIPQAMGYESERSSMRIGYVGSSGWSNWSGRYSSLDGNMKKTIHAADKTLEIAVETTSGNISIEVYDNNNVLVWSRENISTESFSVEIPDEKAVVRILSDNHKGSFDIKG